MRSLITKLSVFTVAIFAASLVSQSSAGAITGWNAGRIINDDVFTANTSMSTTQIQTFLNSKVPTCDTNGQQLSEYGGPDLNKDGKVQRWEWGKANYNQTTFPCIRDYSEGGKKAAQIIYEKAQLYRISPKVLIVLLQKEQSLITDTWPLTGQYRTATGYGCPDTAPCDSQYYGLTNQLDWASKMFRAIMNDAPTWYTPYELGSNYIQYNPVASCGGSNVVIENRSTQALYNYTPYQPNQGALNAGWGSAQCGAYGNRNFFLYFSSWFGQPNASSAYSYQLTAADVYSDEAMTLRVGGTTAAVEPGKPFYVRLKIKNTGNQVWYREFFRIGTTYDTNRASLFADPTWISAARPAKMLEEAVSGGQSATLQFKMNAPNELNSFTERFGVLLEGQRWFGGSFGLTINVATSDPFYSAKTTSIKAYRDDEKTMQQSMPTTTYPESKIYISMIVKNTGNRDLPANTTRIATTNPRNRISEFSDTSWFNTNRPAIATTSIAPGNSTTLNFSLTVPADQTGNHIEQFGLLIEGDRWITDDLARVNMNVLDRPPVQLNPGEALSPGTSLLSSDERFRLVLQGDGNLVLYGTNGALWSTRTGRTSGNRLVLQGDGNLVLYGTNGALWSTRTAGSK